MLMMRFTAFCNDKALRRDIFKIKGLTWDCLRMDTVTSTRYKLFNMNLSNTGSSASSLSAPSRTSTTHPTPSPFAQNAQGQDQKDPEWIHDRNKEKSKLVGGIRSNRERRKNDEGDRAPRPRPHGLPKVPMHGPLRI